MRNRAEGWQHAKLSGHENEALLEALVENDGELQNRLLACGKFPYADIAEIDFGGLRESEVDCILGGKTKSKSDMHIYLSNGKQINVSNMMRNCNFADEAKERYSNTDAYREYEKKTKRYTKEKWAEANDGLMAIFTEFAACKQRGADADSNEAQALVAKLQEHITSNYYTCTDEILAGLGKMYIFDERFKKNIDKYAEGTAEFASEAIAVFCQEK